MILLLFIFSPVKKSILGKELLGHAHDLWKLLPAFCRGSSDTDKQFRRLAVLLTDFLKKDSFMHESVALALKVIFLATMMAFGSLLFFSWEEVIIPFSDLLIALL